MKKPLSYYLVFSLVAIPAYADLPVIGWIEDITITGQQIRFAAKIDTGADNTSLHIDDYKIIRKSGVDWVSFEFTDKDGEHVRVDRKLEKMIRVKRKLQSAQERPVVNLFVCLGNVGKIVQVNLIDRGNYKYRVLIGRSFLKEAYLVDSGKKHLSKPACIAPAK